MDILIIMCKMVKKTRFIPMDKRRFIGIRILVMVILALLVVQFELGIVSNLAGPPELAPFSAFSSKFTDALNQAGLVTTIHADVGSLLPLVALAGLILSLRTRVRSVQVVGVLAFITVLFAAIAGLLFVASGFQNDTFSEMMAAGFILSLVLYFLELYFLKPAPKTQSA
jgi:hypothetical protein